MKCPPESTGFVSEGAYCLKPMTYGKGMGSTEKCPGCQKWGILWYPKCHEGYHSIGCCFCSPDCQYGMEDLGDRCAKRIYSRSVGKPMVCPAGKELAYDGLCYDICDKGTDGFGTLCWGQCPTGMTKCGTLCLAEGHKCVDYPYMPSREVIA